MAEWDQYYFTPWAQESGDTRELEQGLSAEAGTGGESV